MTDPVLGPLTFNSTDGWTRDEPLSLGGHDVSLLVLAGPEGPSDEHREWVRLTIDRFDVVEADVLALLDHVLQPLGIGRSDVTPFQLMVGPHEAGPFEGRLYYDVAHDEVDSLYVRSVEMWTVLEPYLNEEGGAELTWTLPDRRDELVGTIAFNGDSGWSNREPFVFAGRETQVLYLAGPAGPGPEHRVWLQAAVDQGHDLARRAGAMAAERAGLGPRSSHRGHPPGGRRQRRPVRRQPDVPWRERRSLLRLHPRPLQDAVAGARVTGSPAAHQARSLNSNLSLEPTVQHITLDREEGILVITLSRGKANALNCEMVDELQQALNHALGDDRTHGVVITSGTPKMFCGGFDVQEVFNYPPEKLERYMARFIRLFDTLRCLPKPTVAGLNGHSYAGGSILALACDERIMAEGDFKFALNEVSLGVVLPARMVQAMAAVVPGSHGAPDVPRGARLARARRPAAWHRRGTGAPRQRAISGTDDGARARVASAARVRRAQAGTGRGGWWPALFARGDRDDGRGVRGRLVRRGVPVLPRPARRAAAGHVAVGLALARHSACAKAGPTRS